MPIAPFVRRRRYPVVAEDGVTPTYAADFTRASSEYLSIVSNADLAVGSSVER